MLRAGLWLLLLGLAACQNQGTASIRWSVLFANPDSAARASRVDLSIVEGSCSSTSEVYASSVTRDAEATPPGPLAVGRYSLRGRAISEDCTLVAAGCVQISLPTSRGELVELVLDDVLEERVCAGACAERCVAHSDGGAGDGSTPELDASGPKPGAPEGGMADAGLSCDALQGPNGRCYRLERSLRTFADAETACLGWGGHLVSFNDAAEEQWVSEQAAVLAVDRVPPDFWIGFTDGTTEARWVWTDGSTAASSVVSFTDEPNKVQYRTASDTPYVHWGPNPQTVGNGQPNNSSRDAAEGQDCAASMGKKVSGPGGLAPRPEWDDRVCSELKTSVCERR